MKHIRQSSQKHTAGSFNVTEDISCLAPHTYLVTELNFPFLDIFKKLAPVFRGSDPRNLKEDLPEMPGIGSPGRYATPGQALPLNMDQASLHYDTRPELTDNSHYGTITIHGKTMWIQSRLFQACQEFDKLGFRIFGDTVLASYEGVCVGIHQGNKATRTSKECPIQDKALVLFQVRNGLWRHLFQIVVDHTVKFPWAIAALIRQLSGRITFNNPESKKFIFFGTSDLIAPASSATRAPTRSTEPALFPLGTMTISPKNV